MRDHQVRRGVLLALPAVLALLGMHALVVGPALGGPHPGTSHATQHEVATAKGADAAGTSGLVAAHPVADVPPAGPHGSTGHSGLDHVVHLCLAVLVAVAAVLLVGWSFRGWSRPPWSGRRGPVLASGRPAARPPPVPRRLAQLCVMRT